MLRLEPEVSTDFRTRRSESAVHEFRVMSGDSARYFVTVLDVEASSAMTTCLIVPQGREHEFVFATECGLRQIGSSCGSGRLISVRLNGHSHSFKDLESVRQELSGIAVRLSANGAERIPFATPGGDMGNRRVREVGRLSNGDEYYVEEIEQGKSVTRRLVFASNPFSIQTEIAVAAKKKKKKRALHLASAYHSAILAGLVGFECLEDVCLVGLGGGALATALARCSSKDARLRVVELDPVVVEIAKNWFGFDNKRPHLVVDCVDGLTAFDKDEKSYDAVVVDVDSKDASKGMSCPPEEFVQIEYLEKLKRSARRLVAFNVVARDENERRRALTNISSVFPVVCRLRPDEDDVNVVVFASTNNETPLHEDGEGLSLQKRKLQDTVRRWLSSSTSNLGDDPLGLAEMIDLIA